MKEGIWLILAAVVWIGWRIFKTGRLNNDTTQQELCALIVELDRSPKDDNNLNIFTVGYLRALMFTDGDRSTRLAHALSMARPRISPDTYSYVKSMFRRDAKAG